MKQPDAVDLDFAVDVVQDFFDEVLELAHEMAGDEDYDRVVFIEDCWQQIVSAL
tara:strand:- start:278 stop:439 length:162 start_codon:yes stop_codon:yes gene_type:complete